MPFDPDVLKALFVEVNTVLSDPAEMFKGCASLIEKALDVVLDLCCQSREGATQWMSSALRLRAWMQQPRHNVQAILDLFEKMNALLAAACAFRATHQATCARHCRQ